MTVNGSQLGFRTKQSDSACCYLHREGYIFIGVCWYVSWQDYAKTTEPVSQNSVKKGSCRVPRKKRLDYGGNPDHVSLVYG